MTQDSAADEFIGATLRDRLEYALLPNGIRQQEQFLPAGCLESICAKVAVFTELSRYFDEEEAKHVTSYICDPRKPAKKIFAILALINRIELIETFRYATFTDQDLPLAKNIEESGLRSRWPEDQRTVLLTRSLRDIKAIRDFNLKQWCVNIPFFGRGVCQTYGDLVFDSDAIMPWESAGHNIVTGGYGFVQKVKIHKDHHSFETGYKSFALKTILPAKEKARGIFRQELVAFRKPAIHWGFPKLQTLVSPDFTVNHLEQEEADLLRIDARKNTAHPNMILAISSLGKWTYGHLAAFSLSSSLGCFSNIKHVKNSAKQESKMPCFQETGATSRMTKTTLRTTFFQRHIEINRTKTFHRLLRDHPKIGYVKQTRVGRKEKVRLDQANSSASSRQFKQIPRLKPSVSQLVNEIHYRNGPAFLGKFLRFIKKEMLHPAPAQQLGSYSPEHQPQPEHDLQMLPYKPTNSQTIADPFITQSITGSPISASS
ncbi:uncharacterized protein Y057_1533 [Fusarium fujikuroi]|nr:uncharacterized protein Y057_1533 [Fusarium fujikuroi]